MTDVARRGLIRAPRRPWPGGGRGIGAALKWLPASSCREGRCSGPTAACPPLAARCAPASAARQRPPPAAAEAQPRRPALTTLLKAKAGRPPRLLSSPRRVTPRTALLCAARAARHRHGNRSVAPSLVIEQLRHRASLNLLLHKLMRSSEGLVS